MPGTDKLSLIKNLEPLNLTIMDVDKFIRADDCGEVTSSFIKESSTNGFDPKGLYSEQIFGQVADPRRLVKFGYINLHCTVFHPGIFDIIVRLKRVYEDIMAGKTYAIFDAKTKELVPCADDTEGARTGFGFFAEMYPKLSFNATGALSRDDRIAILKKYKDLVFISKHPVQPAGIRDYNEEAGGVEKINKLYTSLLSYSRAVPPGNAYMRPIYDGIRYGIQRKVNEIHQYIYDMMEGKYGYLQRKYANRSLAFGTRNVISAADMSAASLDDPTFLKCDETRMPLFEAIKAFQPLVVYNLKFLYLSYVFSNAADQIGLIDPKTYQLEYHRVNETIKDMFLTSDGISKMFNRFWDVEIRQEPVTITDEKGKPYYLAMVYDDGGKNIYHLRDVAAFKAKHPKDFRPDFLRPLTYIEMLYVSTYYATIKRHESTTRYPAIGLGSTYPAKVHLSSTNPGRTISLLCPFNNELGVMLPEYPVMGKGYIDSLTPHPGHLAGLGGDHDGDTSSGHGIMADESNEEIADHLESLKSVLRPNGEFALTYTTNVELTVYNLSRPLDK